MARALIGSDGQTIMQIVPDDQEFPAHPSLRWVNAPGNVTTRWSYDGSRFVPPPPNPPPDPLPASRAYRLAVKLHAKGILTQQDLDEIGTEGRNENAPRRP